jgi:hypothetical protein
MAELARQSTLADRIADHVTRTTHRRPAASEVRSWERSLPVLANDLYDAGLHEVEMLVEYQLPLTDKRADVVLAGVHPRSGDDCYLVVELKQWTHAEVWEEDPNLVLVANARGGPRLHPGLQVDGYCHYMSDFLGVLEHEQRLKGVAYLHNAVDAEVEDLFTLQPSEWSRIYTQQRRGEFLEYLRHNLAGGPGAGAADRLLASAVRPSKKLLTLAATTIKERNQFVLLNEQRLAYEIVRHIVDTSHRSNNKTAVVVAGGPGSGKSVIALSLLSELAGRGRTVLHATGSKSFTETMRRYAGRGSKRVKDLFKFFHNFMAAEPNDLDVLICDEAHRIRRTSANRFTKSHMRTGRPQLEELLSAARVPVFMLDEHQVVRPGEVGTLDVIHHESDRLGIRFELVSLHGQFRCGGSVAYERWVHRLLGLADGGPEPWTGDERFEVLVADTPWHLESVLAGKDQGDTARMAAGFCWPWNEPRPDGSLVNDVIIGDWSRPWNLKSPNAVGNVPSKDFWATDPRGFGQVGCVYTAQGFEYDWAGVILGPDIVARDGRLITLREHNRDPKLRSRKSVPDDEFDRLVRNTYKVLLTRGMKGIVLYATDPATREFLTELVRPNVTGRRSEATAASTNRD